MSAALYLVVASHLGTQMPGGARTRDEALAHFGQMLTAQAESEERPDLYGPWSDTSLRVVSEQQWLGSQAIKARQEAAR